MRTDIPLKRLLLLRGTDLLPLFAAPLTTVLRVESLELPANNARLDTVFYLRSAGGQEYIHVIEWQGYHDPAVLWRMASYLAWLGQRHPKTAILGTLVYLAPAYDVGDTLTQTIDGQVVQTWQMDCLRLWEYDASDALQSGNLGLTILSPLMRHTSRQSIEQAIGLVVQQAPVPQQADLLSILGIFAEPVIAPDQFVQLVGRERLMSSDLVSYLVEEQMAEMRTEFQQALADTIIKRFPQAPIALMDNIRRIKQPSQLRTLITAVLEATDLNEVEQLLKQASAS
ncbi:MAG: hypothetical protein MI924_22970 [Chloroflexales bacterium]|nr:hypothetical protein [Chloroflexales bacterium]